MASCNHQWTKRWFLCTIALYGASSSSERKERNAKSACIVILKLGIRNLQFLNSRYSIKIFIFHLKVPLLNVIYLNHVICLIFMSSLIRIAWSASANKLLGTYDLPAQFLDLVNMIFWFGTFFLSPCPVWSFDFIISWSFAFAWPTWSFGYV